MAFFFHDEGMILNKQIADGIGTKKKTRKRVFHVFI